MNENLSQAAAIVKELKGPPAAVSRSAPGGRAGAHARVKSRMALILFDMKYRNWDNSLSEPAVAGL